MIDERELLERELERFTPGPGMVERVERRRARKQRRQRLAAGALGVGLAGAVAAAALAIWNTDPGTGDTPTPAPPPKLARPYPLIALDRGGLYAVNIRTLEATPAPASITSIRGAANFDVSPNGSMILFDDSGIDPPRDPGDMQVYVSNIDGSDLRPLTDEPIGASDPSWSPDGRKVVYVGAGSRREPEALTVMDVGTGSTSVLARSRQGFVDPAFSPDGTSIQFSRGDPEGSDWGREDLWGVPAAGGPTTLVLEDRGWARFSPDGTVVSYTWIESTIVGNCGASYGVAWISDADGSDPRLLDPVATRDGRSTWATGGWSPDGTKLAYTVAFTRMCEDGAETAGVYVDMEGAKTLVTYGEPLDWLDDQTLLIRAQEAPQP
jgi:dipeptidyl aminopeptidase/acylaminoacyl peptidase